MEGSATGESASLESPRSIGHQPSLTAHPVAVNDSDQSSLYLRERAGVRAGWWRMFARRLLRERKNRSRVRSCESDYFFAGPNVCRSPAPPDPLPGGGGNKLPLLPGEGWGEGWVVDVRLRVAPRLQERRPLFDFKNGLISRRPNAHRSPRPPPNPLPGVRGNELPLGEGESGFGGDQSELLGDVSQGGYDVLDVIAERDVQQFRPGMDVLARHRRRE